MSPLFAENTTVFFSEEQVEHKGPRGGFGGPQGGLDDSLHRGGGGEVVRQARGGEGGGSGSIPARQTAGKTIGGRVLLRLNAKVCGFR